MPSRTTCPVESVTVTYYVIGERPSGDRLILASAASEAEAQEEASRLRECDGYSQIVVEKALLDGPDA